MKQLVFSTSNSEKFLVAKHACSHFGIQLIQKNVDINEIQDEDPEKVARDKAVRAYEATKHPIVITDDSWALLGLKGFPGVYMHSINEWFTPEDFLRLVLPLKNRKVVYTQFLIYTDGYKQKVFTRQNRGTLLKGIRGRSDHSSHTIISLDSDHGLSIAEAYDQSIDKSSRKSTQIWHDFAKWYSEL